MSGWLALPILLLLAFAGIPIFIVLGLGALFGALMLGLDSAVLLIEMNRLASSPNLLAIPLFTLCGVILAHGGAAERLIKLFRAYIGFLPGGIALVTVVSASLFTAFSGASGMTILALGGLLYPVLLKNRYDQKFSLGLITSSGSLGLLLPPSLAVLIYGLIASVDIKSIFIAGLIPSLILLLFFYLYSSWHERRHFEPCPPLSWVEMLKASRDGISDLLLPVLIVWLIYSGITTVSETAVISVCYVWISEAWIHKRISILRDLMPILNEASVLVGSILMILAMSLGLTNLLVDARVPMQLLDLIRTYIDSPLMFLLLLNIFLLFVGALVDIFSAIIIFVPLITPIALQFGVNPVHLAVVILANLEIGYSTPPIGVNLFIASKRLNKPIVECFIATLPFLLLMLLWLGLVTYLPWLTLWWL